MSANQQLLAEIDAFLHATGMPETQFGQKACGNWLLMERLRGGGSVTLKTADRIRTFMSENRPARERRRRVA
jgi:hypothetical protein